MPTKTPAKLIAWPLNPAFTLRSKVRKLKDRRSLRRIAKSLTEQLAKTSEQARQARLKLDLPCDTMLAFELAFAPDVEGLREDILTLITHLERAQLAGLSVPALDVSEGEVISIAR